LLEVLDDSGVQLRHLIVAGRTATAATVTAKQSDASPTPSRSSSRSRKIGVGVARTAVPHPKSEVDPPDAWSRDLLVALANMRSLARLHVSRAQLFDADLERLLAALPLLATVRLADTRVTEHFCAAAIASGRAIEFSVDGPPLPDALFLQPAPAAVTMGS
jgi:hypothetical protein